MTDTRDWICWTTCYGFDGPDWTTCSIHDLRGEIARLKALSPQLGLDILIE